MRERLKTSRVSRRQALTSSTFLIATAAATETGAASSNIEPKPRWEARCQL